MLFAHLLLSAACRTDVGCCSEDYHKHQDVFRLPEDLKVGKCWWTLHYTGIPDRRQPAGRQGGPGDDFRDVFLIGTYEMTCEMEEESEKCGEPLCDDLVLHGWGRLYLDTNAAIKGKPTVTGCDISDRRRTWMESRGPAPQTPAVKPAASDKANPAKIASADSYYGHDESEYFLGVLLRPSLSWCKAGLGCKAGDRACQLACIFPQWQAVIVQIQLAPEVMVAHLAVVRETET